MHAGSEYPESNRFNGIAATGLSVCEERAVLALARHVAERQLLREGVLTSPADSRRHLVAAYAGYESERFGVIYLDTRHRIIAFEPEVFCGSIDGASVHPRELVRRCLCFNAAAVIFAHNHPSGVPEPSAADEALTRTLKEALALVDVRVLDHIVVAGFQTVSLAERGLL